MTFLMRSSNDWVVFVVFDIVVVIIGDEEFVAKLQTGGSPRGQKGNGRPNFSMDVSMMSERRRLEVSNDATNSIWKSTNIRRYQGY